MAPFCSDSQDLFSFFHFLLLVVRFLKVLKVVLADQAAFIPTLATDDANCIAYDTKERYIAYEGVLLWLMHVTVPSKFQQCEDRIPESRT